MRRATSSCNGASKLRAGGGDVASQNKQFGIEHVQKADQRGRERFESEIQHATRTRVSLRCRLKDSLRSGNPAGIVER